MIGDMTQKKIFSTQVPVIDEAAHHLKTRKSQNNKCQERRMNIGKIDLIETGTHKSEKH